MVVIFVYLMRIKLEMFFKIIQSKPQIKKSVEICCNLLFNKKKIHGLSVECVSYAVTKNSGQNPLSEPRVSKREKKKKRTFDEIYGSP